MNNPIYAMDTFFYNSQGVYPFETRCEMIKEAGYDSTYLTFWSDEAWQDVEKLTSVTERYGLQIAAVYVVLDIAAVEYSLDNHRILRLVETMEGCSTIEIAINASDIASVHDDEQAILWLNRILKAAESRNIQILLYPHISNWMETAQDALRLCEKIKHPQLGIIFPLFHWYAVDNSNLANLLVEISPYLRAVNLSGSRKNSDNATGLPATIELLDQGEIDMFYVLGLLRRINFQGPIGFQGYSIGGDAYRNIQHNLQVFHELNDRLNRHINWSFMKEYK
ncbi:sugar phosphate isomerase/epimerase [Paenibacillus castaneae]|uniref:sugar phosphate isomerase/epimerase family protein n=1 Tax=Paenibacillus castaneae TaxID=474957 RepID=UPI000C9C1771|nr:TIM barrel protein [Paenibacillus castaneae]NIK76857.1 sugar phosphate isomerase/epimerase [Paenibacillus castaneae]